MPGTTVQPSNIGQYKIIKLLGKGGMGNVWLGEHHLLGRRAAIKTLLPTLSSQVEIVDRFFQEARATAAIRDPGVVQIYDFGYHVDGTAYIVMELLEGEALCDRMERLGPLPLVHALRIVRQVAGALGAAHEAGIVHRDVKPENIFIIGEEDVTGGERAKILDFGICKSDKNPRATDTGTMLGTPVYMSPEQCRGSRSVDERSDIYALGCVLFHMLTDRTPFEANGSGEYIVAHLNDPAPAPSTRIAGMTPEVDELVLRCMAKDPGERFQTMHELQRAVDDILDGMTVEAVVEKAPRALKLASGFRSNYDGNFDVFTPSGGRETPRERPSPLHVTRTPITVHSNAAAWQVVGRTLGGFSVLGFALFAGFAAYNFTEAGGTEAAVAALTKPSTSPTTTLRDPAATVAPVAIVEPMLTVPAVPPVPAGPDAGDDAVVLAHELNRVVLTAAFAPPVVAVVTPAPKRAPARANRGARRPEIRLVKPAPKAAPSLQREDLYDTR